MGTQFRTRMRQVVDWEAAVVASLVSGLIVFIFNFIVTWVLMGDAWIFLRMNASLLLGESTLTSSPLFDPVISITGLIIYMLLSVFYGCLIAVIIYRWGFLVGFFGGALLGLAIYAINFFALSYFFPWFYPMQSWIPLLSYVLFGALAGGFYELLEEEEFVPIEEKVEG